MRDRIRATHSQSQPARLASFRLSVLPSVSQIIRPDHLNPSHPFEHIQLETINTLTSGIPSGEKKMESIALASDAPLLMLLAATALSDAAADSQPASQLDADDVHADGSSDVDAPMSPASSTDTEADSGSEAEATVAVSEAPAHAEPDFERLSRENRALRESDSAARDGVCPCDSVRLPSDLSQLAHETWAHMPFPQARGTLINSGTNKEGNRWYSFLYRGAKELLYENKPRPNTGVRSTWMRRGDGVCFYQETPGQSPHAHRQRCANE